jgi:ribose-phosphate pyrophosphokinase
MSLLHQTGADELVTVELHNPMTVEHAPLPVINIRPYAFLAQAVRERTTFEDLTVITPDSGSLERAQEVAQELKGQLMLFEKERYDVNRTRITRVEGNCKTVDGLIVDDIIDTGSTLVNVARALQGELGSCRLSVLAVHARLSGGAVARLEQFPFERIYVTNSITQPTPLPERYVVIDIAPLIAEWIQGSMQL